MLTRRSSGALVDMDATNFQKPSSSRSFLSAPASQSGMLWRSFSENALRSIALHAVAQPLLFVLRPCAPRISVSLPCQARIDQAAFERAAAALGQMLEQQALAQHGIGGLGQRVALARAQLAVLAEEVRDDDVRGHVELADLAEQFGGGVEEDGRMHGSVFRGYR